MSSEKKKITIAIMADFSRSYGKGKELEAIFNAAKNKKQNIEYNFFVRDKSGAVESPALRIKNVNIFSNIPYKIFSGIERYIANNFRSRLHQERLFDYNLSKKLSDSQDLFLGNPRMTKSFMVAKKNGIKTVLHAFELHPEFNRHLLKETYPDKLNMPSIWDEDYLNESNQTLSYVDYVFCPSEFTKMTYLENGFPKDKLIVFPLGYHPINFADSSILKHEINESKIKCLYVGNVTKLKGCHLLLEAFKLLSDDLFELHMCGPIQTDMKSEIQKVKGKLNIYFHGFVNPVSWYKSSDIFVFPSLSDSFARVVLEAASYGLPIICTDCATASVIKNRVSGIIIKPSGFSIAEAISSLVANKHNIPMFAKLAQKKSLKLTYEHFGESTIRELSKLI